MMKRKFVPLFLIIVFANVLYFVVFSGKRAPEIPIDKTVLFDENEKKVTLTENKGNVMIVSYFQSWCGECRTEFLELEALQKAVGGDSKLKIFLVTDEDWNTVNQVRNVIKTNLTFYRSEKKLKDIGIRRFPITYLLNKEGKVVSSKVEGVHWNTKEIQAEILELNK